MLVLQEDISDGYSRKEILLPQVFCKIPGGTEKMDIKNKNELKRRIDLFLHDFTHEEYRINEEYCKETMRIMVDFIGHVDNRLDAADKRLKKAKAGEKALAEYIISNAHSCPIPVEMVCKPGFQQIGCVQCLIKHLDVLNKPRED